MTFIVGRASARGEKPCKEAYKTKATYLDRRTFKTQKEAITKLKKLGEDWLGRGTNHREIEGGGVTREMEERDVWVIDIQDLDALVLFCHAHGDIIISESDYKGFPYELVIYDDYIE